jgi:hypothetical protein
VETAIFFLLGGKDEKSSSARHFRFGVMGMHGPENLIFRSSPSIRSVPLAGLAGLSLAKLRSLSRSSAGTHTGTRAQAIGRAGSPV